MTSATVGPARTSQIDISPSPAALLQSMRGLGYTPETAIADLIDNCLAAGAGRVSVWMDWGDGDPVIQIRDDGRGMTPAQIQDALRFGGRGPDEARSADDLGRFGLGLKTASLSQGRRLTIAAYGSANLTVAELDVDDVAGSGCWSATVLAAPPAGPLTSAFLSYGKGALVTVGRMDPQAALWKLDRNAFNAKVADVKAHLAMTFHRFLSGEVRRMSLELNGRPIAPWDPFCRWHDATYPMPRDRASSDGISVQVKPYVLPHRDRFATDAAWEAAGGPGGWTERQGFYVYRGNRLVSAGGWLGLGGARAWTREESSKLARISIDLPTSADAIWRIDVRKAVARAPAGVRGRLTDVAAECRRRAREVFAWRGSPVRSPRGTRSEDAPSPWVAVGTAGSLRYRISRDHPVIRQLRLRSGDEPAFEGMLKLIELSVPVERIWLDVSDSGGATVPTISADDEQPLIESLAALILSVPSDNNLHDRVDALLHAMRLNDERLRTSILKRLGDDA